MIYLFYNLAVNGGGGGAEDGGGDQDSTWDAIHVCNHEASGNSTFTHTINTTVFLMMKTNAAQHGDVEVAGNASRVLSETVTMDKIDAKDPQKFHLATIGALVEPNETQVRRDIKGQLLDKTKLIINTGRLSHEYKRGADSKSMQAELMAAVLAKRQGN